MKIVWMSAVVVCTRSSRPKFSMVVAGSAHKSSTHTNLAQSEYPSAKNKLSRITHTRELDATVTTLGSGTLLLQVKVSQLTTGGLDDANLVGPRVVAIGRKPSINHSKYIFDVFSSYSGSIDVKGEDVFEGRNFFHIRVAAALCDGKKPQSVQSIKANSRQR